MNRPPSLCAAVLTVSDRCARGESIDTTGPALRQLLTERLGAAIVEARCVPDEPTEIASAIRTWCDQSPTIALILTTGGTGFAPRDRTPEAVRPLLEREASGLLELARMRTLVSTPRSVLSRGIAGLRGRTLILTLPGSERGALEQCEAILDVLPHALDQARGAPDDHHDPRPKPSAGAVSDLRESHEL